MLNVINYACPYLGFALFFYAWRAERLNTKPVAIQITMILYVLLWVSLYLADTAQNHIATTGTVIARMSALLIQIGINCYVYSTTEYIRKLKTQT